MQWNQSSFVFPNFVGTSDGFLDKFPSLPDSLHHFLTLTPTLPHFLPDSLPHSHSLPDTLPHSHFLPDTLPHSHSHPPVDISTIWKVLTFHVTGNRPITMATTLLQASTEYGRCRGHSAGHGQCFPFVIDLLATKQLQMLPRNTSLGMYGYHAHWLNNWYSWYSGV